MTATTKLTSNPAPSTKDTKSVPSSGVTTSLPPSSTAVVVPVCGSVAAPSPTGDESSTVVAPPVVAPPVTTTVQGVATLRPADTAKPAATAKVSLRSGPVPARVKEELKLASASSGPAVIDVDADWTDDTPMDFNQRIQKALERMASPPNDLDPDVVEEPADTGVTEVVDSTVRAPPSTELPTGSLRSEWMACSRPIQAVNKKYLKADGFLNRVDVAIYRAVDARGDGNAGDALWCREAIQRFVQIHKGYYRIPLSIRCDRSFLERPHDASYVERMWLYLFNDSVTTPPVLSDPSLYSVYVTEDRTKSCQNRLMWAILIMRKRVVTHEDFFVARAVVNMNKAAVPEVEEEALLSIPWDLFLVIPAWMSNIVDLRSAPVSPVRALTYFAGTARRQRPTVYQKWNKSLQFELAMHVAVAHYAAWARPVLDQTRLWYPPESHIKWLKDFTHLPPVPAYFESSGKFVEASIADVVKVLEDARARAVPVKRRDYCRRTNVEFVVTPKSHIYVDDPLCEALKRPTNPPADVSMVEAPASQPSQPSTVPKSTANAPRGVVTGRVYKRDSCRRVPRCRLSC